MIESRILFTAAAVSVACFGEALAGGNLLLNDGFESPSAGASKESDTDAANWTVFSSVNGSEKVGLSAVARTGKQAARVTAQGVVDSYQGLFQAISVTPGTSYHFSLFVRNDKSHPLKGTARGQVSIEWKDAHDAEIERAWGPTWGVSLSSTDWVRFDMTVKAPANAAKAHFVVTQFDGKDADSGGSFLLDDATVTEQK